MATIAVHSVSLERAAPVELALSVMRVTVAQMGYANVPLAKSGVTVVLIAAVTLV